MPEIHSSDPPATEPIVRSVALEAVRAQVDPLLAAFLRDRRAELAAMDPTAGVLVDELIRLLDAGGKRFRPALCFWSHRAVGGREGEPILRVCAALELLHTSALVHDDVMDGDLERRGVPATHVRFAERAPDGMDPASYGTAAAIVVGDLALVLSEQAIRTSGFPNDRLEPAMARFDAMRAEMAAGQFLDVSGAADRVRVDELKSASYTAVGPILIGAALASADAAATDRLSAYATAVGTAFQLRDDVLDGDAPPTAAADVNEHVERAERALAGSSLEPRAVDALAELAGLLRLAAAA
ncbi:MAG: polyprenyl synthetase family protein [Actinobacteria bacterium]|nr:polyprenyl synthetase family protein [Actinomycetota bacterium]